MSKVLLAEDDQTMLSLLKTLLGMEGFAVVALEAGSDVMELLRREQPDFLVMDVHLGRQSGMEIVETIRKDPAFSNLQIVMTSGLNVRDECLRLGANHFLLKPFMPDDLLGVLKQ